MRSLCSVTNTWAKSSSDSFTATFQGIGQDHQYIGAIASDLTEAQLLAQSFASTQLVPGWTFCALSNNSGTDSSGNSHNMTLTGTASASSSTFPTGIPAEDLHDATRIGIWYNNFNVGLEVNASPSNGNSTYAVSFAVKARAAIGSDYIDYVTSLHVDSNECLVTAIQYTHSVNILQLYQSVGYHGGVNFTYGGIVETVTDAVAANWIYMVAVYIENSGSGTTSCKLYRALNWSSTATLSLVNTTSIPFLPSAVTRKSGVAKMMENHSFDIAFWRSFTREPSLAELQAIMISSAPVLATNDSSIVFDVSLCDTDGSDRSGKGNNGVFNNDVFRGVANPTLNGSNLGVDVIFPSHNIWTNALLRM
jgi:hypothetical protein